MRHTLTHTSPTPYYTVQDRTFQFVSQARTRRGTNTRDKVYGLSGIRDIRVEIDYSVTVEVLFTLFASHFATRITDLNDILKAVSVSQNTNTKSLPAWVPDWEQHIVRAQGLFSANKGCPPPTGKVETAGGINNDRLLVTGVCLDVVEEVLPASQPTTATSGHVLEGLREIAPIAEFLFRQGAEAVLSIFYHPCPGSHSRCPGCVPRGTLHQLHVVQPPFKLKASFPYR